MLSTLGHEQPAVYVPEVQVSAERDLSSEERAVAESARGPAKVERQTKAVEHGRMLESLLSF